MCLHSRKYAHACYDYITGYAGSDEKVAYIKGLGFDEAINYKKVDSLNGSLQQACPKGIDIFWDNVSNTYKLYYCCHYNIISWN